MSVLTDVRREKRFEARLEENACGPTGPTASRSNRREMQEDPGVLSTWVHALDPGLASRSERATKAAGSAFAEPRRQFTPPPQTFAMPPPPQLCGERQSPQLRMLPQPSET